MERRFKEYHDSLNKMLRYATLRSEVLLDYGLNGKLGMAILFFEYDRLHKDDLYRLYAEELLDDILKLPNTTPLTFQDGLIGIAWGMVYLHRNKFISGDLQEILGDIDDILKANLSTTDRDYLSYLAYRHEDETKGNIYPQEEVMDMIWNNWA